MNHLSKEKINLLRQQARSVVRELGLLNDAYFDIDVTLAERHFLIELSSSVYPTVGDIAERLLLDKSTASRLIAKTVKKGYVTYSADTEDKRKRFLALTKKGSAILHAFEPIAFNQTKEALLTLTPEEVQIVYQGIALYAKGLKSSRLRRKICIDVITKKDNAGLAHLLSELYKNQKTTIPSNFLQTYQQNGFAYLVMKLEGKVIGGAGISMQANSHCQLENIHILNSVESREFARFLIEECIKKAKSLGYKTCLVENQNQIPAHLFLELGFKKGRNGKLSRAL